MAPPFPGEATFPKLRNSPGREIASIINRRFRRDVAISIRRSARARGKGSHDHADHRDVEPAVFSVAARESTPREQGERCGRETRRLWSGDRGAG